MKEFIIVVIKILVGASLLTSLYFFAMGFVIVLGSALGGLMIQTKYGYYSDDAKRYIEKDLDKAIKEGNSNFIYGILMLFFMAILMAIEINWF